MLVQRAKSGVLHVNQHATWGMSDLLAYLVAAIATTLSATVIIRDKNQRSYPTAAA
jgi:hypothetical protein